MAYSTRTILGQVPYFLLGFGIGIAAWKWMSEDVEENIMSQVVSDIGMALGYLYARRAET